MASAVRQSLQTMYERVERVLVPGLEYSQHIYESVLRRHVKPGTRWLDVGCGHQVLPGWRQQVEDELVGGASTVIGLDYDLRSLRQHRSIRTHARGDVRWLPFRDDSFDLVTANMVVEHLDDPAVQFREIGRVLAPEGVFLFHTPNVFGYSTILARLLPEWVKPRLVTLLEGRSSADVFRTYYRANSRRAITQLAGASDLHLSHIKFIVSTGVFRMVPPIVVAELLWIRLLMSPMLRSLRTNIIAVMQKAVTQGQYSKRDAPHWSAELVSGRRVQ